MAKNRISPIEIQQFLKGMDYPASKEELINHARSSRASEEIIAMLEGMRTNRFSSPSDVSNALND
ncbi:MAG: DUF2795 domain-containing protein [Methylococcaceae bacterium]|nr:DUF2795 domain-containing protein [Prolixibacteraceae bacterium]